MPRIRKKTSNRAKTRDREKVKKKVRDSRKKNVKLAKKNPQWKSKKPKDPGIPNDFPYKDQILAEVQEQRRIVAEEKRRVKEEKQKARAIARGEVVGVEVDGPRDEDHQDGGQDDENRDSEDHKVHGDGIASISAKMITAELKFRRASPIEAESDPEGVEPVLVNRDLSNLASVLEKADVVVEVLDARDPLAYRSKHLEELAKQKGKKVLLVMNKIDRCPREAVAAWAGYLRTEQPTVLFRSASSFLAEGQTSQPSQPKKPRGKAKTPVNDAVGADSILSCLSEWAKHDEPLAVAILGVANVGKSSLINSLLKKSSLPVYALASSLEGPTTTELPQEVSLDFDGKTITFIDTPGFSFLPSEGESVQDIRAKDILLRSKGRIDRLKDPSPPISHIVSRANKEDLMLLYSLPAFATGDSIAFLSGVARTNQLVKRSYIADNITNTSSQNGDLDLTGAARIVLRDWNIGKFARYTAPAPRVKEHSEDIDADSFLTSLYAKDAPILGALATRKEMRKHRGLVRLSAGTVEERKVVIEENWSALEDQGNDDSSDDDEVENVDSDSMEEEAKEDWEEADTPANEDDEPSLSIPFPLKQKRKRTEASSALARPTKKVSLGGVASPIVATTRKRHLSTATQQKKGEVPSLVPKVAPPKSILKSRAGASGTSGVVAKTMTHTMKVTKAPRSAANGKQAMNEQEAYDFGKFF